MSQEIRKSKRLLEKSLNYQLTPQPKRRGRSNTLSEVPEFHDPEESTREEHKEQLRRQSRQLETRLQRIVLQPTEQIDLNATLGHEQNKITHGNEQKFSLLDFQIGFPEQNQNLSPSQAINNNREPAIDQPLPVYPSDSLELSSHSELEDSLSYEEKRYAKMAITVEDYINLIPEFRGQWHELNSYVKIIDRLWLNLATGFSNNDRQRFSLAVRAKLKGKAATAMADLEEDYWTKIKEILTQKIRPQTTPEVASLQLQRARQEPRESLDDFINRLSHSLSLLNVSYEPTLDTSTKTFLATENNKKAKKALEDGISNKTIQNRLITADLNTFEAAVQYAQTQEIRINELRSSTDAIIQCNYCQMMGHKANECRKRMRETQFQSRFRSSNTGARCYRCNSPNHYAPECPIFNAPRANARSFSYPQHNYKQNGSNPPRFYPRYNENYSHNFQRNSNSDFTRNWPNNSHENYYNSNHNSHQNPNAYRNTSAHFDSYDNRQNFNQRNASNERPQNGNQHSNQTNMTSSGQFRQVKRMPLHQVQAQIHTAPGNLSEN